MQVKDSFINIFGKTFHLFNQSALFVRYMNVYIISVSFFFYFVLKKHIIYIFYRFLKTFLSDFSKGLLNNIFNRPFKLELIIIIINNNLNQEENNFYFLYRKTSRRNVRLCRVR